MAKPKINWGQQAGQGTAERAEASMKKFAADNAKRVAEGKRPKPPPAKRARPTREGIKYPAWFQCRRDYQLESNGAWRRATEPPPGFVFFDCSHGCSSDENGEE